METVHVIATGGSLDKFYSLYNSNFEVGEPQVMHIFKDAVVNFDYVIDSVLRKDSLDLTDDDRALILENVRRSPHRHILITHGTDTMTKTGMVLQAAQLDKVIVLTGAMQPAEFRHSDAPFNVGCAVAALQTAPTGVYIAMSGLVLPPDKIRKNYETKRFEPI